MAWPCWDSVFFFFFFLLHLPLVFIKVGIQDCAINFCFFTFLWLELFKTGLSRLFWTSVGNVMRLELSKLFFFSLPVSLCMSIHVTAESLHITSALLLFGDILITVCTYSEETRILFYVVVPHSLLMKFLNSFQRFIICLLYLYITSRLDDNIATLPSNGVFALSFHGDAAALPFHSITGTEKIWSHYSLMSFFSFEDESRHVANIVFMGGSFFSLVLIRLLSPGTTTCLIGFHCHHGLLFVTEEVSFALDSEV